VAGIEQEETGENGEFFQSFSPFSLFAAVQSEGGGT
jgi:hypothetical protein